MTSYAIWAGASGNPERVALQIEAGEAEDDRLPQCAQPGDTNAASAVRIEIEVGVGNLAQIAQRHLGMAQTRRDQRMHPRAERTAVSATRFVIAEILLRYRAREFLR